MKKSFNEIIKPVLVLVCICLIVTALLAYINSVTSPIIAKAEQEKTEQAMSEVLADADGFEKLEIENLPERVTEVYSAQNGSGYVFMLTTKGYGGDMKLICGMKSDGTIEQCKTLSHAETSGLGSKTAEDPYRNQYCGKNADTLSEVDAITGATISSTAYKNAIEDAFKAFDMVKEAGK
ncbi:FMN-binding protein [Ruminococcus sp.]|uniref:FMN-binding protein n=1 Tax=Ruminococcus sp. TaxID=41978 RepID=UPI0025D79F43|nr:FMN-binding protein [Ruminococcus sp.]MCI6617137.1 FMN-binding protein [Ruminococcus sp.]